MNDCDVFNSLTLTTCAVMGILTWHWYLRLGRSPFLLHLVTFVRLSYRGVPHSFHLVSGVCDFSLVILSTLFDVTLGHTPFFFSHDGGV